MSSAADIGEKVACHAGAVICYMDAHEGFAAWLQFIGATIAIVIAIWVPWRQARNDRIADCRSAVAAADAATVLEDCGRAYADAAFPSAEEIGRLLVRFSIVESALAEFAPRSLHSSRAVQLILDLRTALSLCRLGLQQAPNAASTAQAAQAFAVEGRRCVSELQVVLGTAGGKLASMLPAPTMDWLLKAP